MLLAIEIEREDEYGNIQLIVDVVPSHNYIIHSGSRAFIVCSSSQDANRLDIYLFIYLFIFKFLF